MPLHGFELPSVSLGALLNQPPERASNVVTNAFVDRLLPLDRLRSLYGKLKTRSGCPLFTALLNELDITWETTADDRSRVPATGPAIVVANHPFGMVEGAILGDLLTKVRSDVKIMANHILAGLPETANQFIFVDPFGGPGAKAINARALREAIAWLRAGGMLVMFPSGEVSHWDFERHEVTDPEWSETAARLMKISGAGALPVYFKGANGLPFHLLGMVDPRLRTLALPQELFNKKGRALEVRIGSVVANKTIVAIADDRDATQYLRWRTYLLANRDQAPKRRVPRLVRSMLRKPMEPIAAEADKDRMSREVDCLAPGQIVERHGEFRVCLAPAAQIPHVLQELGRLREISFRAAGEGTGASMDLDQFDTYYQHLFVWNDATQEVVGAYRVGDTEKILASHGVPGLYTSTLFHYEPSFFARIGPALELGRSFVRPEYQRHHSPLMLLWKGLCRHVVRNPRTPILFGAVSMSNSYAPTSRNLLAKFFEARQACDELAGLVRPRKPFRVGKLRAQDLASIVRCCRDLSALADLIADIERDGKGIPVLLRQYVRAGGRLLGFSLDKSFSNTLDGLILVDLRHTNRALLSRYMTEEGAAEFLAFHNQSVESLAGAAT